VTDWLTASQQRTWLAYMRVYHRLEYEMNRHLLPECGTSLGDYTVLNVLTNAAGNRMQLTSLATTIGWERSRLSHHLRRMTNRGLVDRLQSNTDGRATDAMLTAMGRRAIKAAAQEKDLADILTPGGDAMFDEAAHTCARPGSSCEEVQKRDRRARTDARAGGIGAGLMLWLAVRRTCRLETLSITRQSSDWLRYRRVQLQP
jgi:DNA-binding MarR family transcriptional regulator